MGERLGRLRTRQLGLGDAGLLRGILLPADLVKCVCRMIIEACNHTKTYRRGRPLLW